MELRMFTCISKNHGGSPRSVSKKVVRFLSAWRQVTSFKYAEIQSVSDPCWMDRSTCLKWVYCPRILNFSGAIYKISSPCHVDRLIGSKHRPRWPQNGQPTTSSFIWWSINFNGTVGILVNHPAPVASVSRTHDFTWEIILELKKFHLISWW